MKNLTFLPVKSADEIKRVTDAAKVIWAEHYSPLIGAEQTAYMIDKFQSEEAIRRQLSSEGYEYYLLVLEGHDAGFIGIVPGTPSLFLSKLYIDSAFRRKGLARAAVDFVCDRAKQDGAEKIWLTVNRGNAGSIAAYQAMGFQTARTQIADIGNGYVMDDYIMEKPV